jgi:hypothetical protein
MDVDPARRGLSENKRTQTQQGNPSQKIAPPHESSSSLRRVTWPATTGSFSILAIAALTFFSIAWCVSITMSTRRSPSPGYFCTMASIEMRESARMRVMSASTPGLSTTRMRR